MLYTTDIQCTVLEINAITVSGLTICTFSLTEGNVALTIDASTKTSLIADLITAIGDLPP